MGELTTNVSWLAVGISTVVCFMLGGFWYSPTLFGEKWAAGVGIEIGADAKQPVPALVTQFLGTFLLAWLVGIMAAREFLLIAIMIVVTASLLLMASRMFGQNGRYATLAEGSFVIVMGIIMVGCQALL